MNSLGKPYPEIQRTEATSDPEINRESPEYKRNPRRKGTLLPAFWSVGAFLSILLNIILIAVVLILAKQLFSIKNLITNDLVGGLYYNFLLMDQATIVTSVQVEDTIPVQFDLPLKQKTMVVLSEDTAIEDATVSLTTGGLNIQQAPTDIILPKGTILPIKLDLSVPVNTEIPISLSVPVEIPLKETELHEPFVGLQEVVSPYYWLLVEQPDSWSQARCIYLGLGCP
ncbi:MAG: hypothetical protein PVI99_09480 [Anaerolineales bacterium]|jgi:hypothetical protein